MKTTLYLLIPVIVALGLFPAFDIPDPRPAAVPSDQDITMCGMPVGTVRAARNGKFIPALKGWGDVSYAVTTRVDSAQFYFNQGLGFYYGYHFTEALASFKEAARFDPECAMAYWGQALAMGPFYNTYVYKMSKDVPPVVEAMVKRMPSTTVKERALIEAMRQRYSNDLTNADRTVLNRNYAVAMSALEKQYPDDNDIAALYIDAVMLEHKWDFWGQDGVARAWTPELVALSERVLQRAKHPAILHYYIHLTEASRQPDKALAAADELKDRIPGIGHMVHMASHMYQRNGLYQQGVAVNDQANDINNVVDALAPDLALGRDRSTHFFAVQSYCAMTAGMYTSASRIYQRARKRQQELSSSMSREVYGQFVYMMPVMAAVRLGQWDAILKSPVVDAQWKYAVVLDNFARGLAYLRRNNSREALRCLNTLTAAMQDSVLAHRLMPFNSPLQSCRIAQAILEGEILFTKKAYAEAIRAYERAIAEEDAMVYREPQDWLIPARQYLGARLLDLKRPKDAERIYQQDLVLHPGTGWSLVGMYHCAQAQKNIQQADAYRTKYTQAFAQADVVINASVF